MLNAPRFYMGGFIFFLIAGIILVLDQASKYIVLGGMITGESISVIDGFFHITYVRNTGAAFGIFADNTMLLSMATAVIMIGISIFVYRKRDELGSLVMICTAMIVAGGTGNLIDRIFRGYVVDFLDFKVWNPVFNVADIFVCTGCFLLIFYILFVEGKTDGKNN